MERRFRKREEYFAGRRLASRQVAGAELRLSKLPDTIDATEALITEARMLAGSQLLTGFSLADMIDRTWGNAKDWSNSAIVTVAALY